MTTYTKIPFLALLLAVTIGPRAASADWPQWGGPTRDFQADAALADWPAEGPTIRWRRPLGEGYSSLAVVGERVYTQYREGDDEIIAAFARADGETVWQHRYPAPHLDGMRMGYGSGPHATPLVVDGRVVAVGATGKLWALDERDGRVLWSRDLWQELDGSFLRRGYAASPLAFDETVILPVGGEGQGLVAFAQTDGAIVWQAQDFKISQASPMLISLAGRPQLVAFVADEIYGLDPRDGRLLWNHAHKSGAVYNISTPLYDADADRLFFSSAYGGGSRALALGWSDPATDDAQPTATKRELFHTNRLKIHYTNGVLVDGHVYGASGNAGRIFLSALDLESGELLWKERRIARANLVVAGERALALDEDGMLFLVTLAPEGLTIHAQHQLVDAPTWTVPALVGDTLFVRNQEELLAVSLPVVEP